MGFIRKKTVKGNEYFYYCEKRRSRLKDGGNGKVITIEKVLGKYLFYPDYLSYWLWDGLTVEDYCYALMSYMEKDVIYKVSGKPAFKTTITWQKKRGKIIAGKVSLRPISYPDHAPADARCKLARKARVDRQEALDRAIAAAPIIEKEIAHIAQWLKHWEDFKIYLAQSENDLKSYRKDPFKEWEKDGITYGYEKDAEVHFTNSVENYRGLVDLASGQYFEALERLLDLCPKGQRDNFKAQVIQRAERLSKNQKMLAIALSP
jgi:hypothetical protein